MNKIELPKTNWIFHMLTTREITLNLHGISINRKNIQRLPTGSYFVATTRTLTPNTLLKRNDMDEDFLQASADNLAILIQGIDFNVTMRGKALRYLTTIDS